MHGEVEWKLEIIEFIQYLGRFFRNDGLPQDDVEIKGGEGIKTNTSRKMMFNFRDVSMGVKRELYDKWWYQR